MKIVKSSEVKAKVYDFWDGIIPKGCVTLLAGGGGSGKTTLACYFAESISKNAKVLFVECEEDEGILKARLDTYSKVDLALKEENKATFSQEEILEALKDYDILFVDSLRSLAGGKDINKAGVAENFLLPYVNAVKGTEKSIVFLAHTNKGNPDSLKDMIAGSERLSSIVRHCKIIINDEMEGRRYLAVAKDNTNCDPTNFEIISNERTIAGQSGSIWVVTRLVQTSMDMEEILIRNSRKFKEKLLEKQYKNLKSRKKEEVPIAIRQVLTASGGKDVTSEFVEKVSNIQSWQYALKRTGSDWVTKTKNGRQVTYHWTEEALEWLREQDEDYPF